MPLDHDKLTSTPCKKKEKKKPCAARYRTHKGYIQMQRKGRRCLLKSARRRAQIHHVISEAFEPHRSKGAGALTNFADVKPAAESNVVHYFALFWGLKLICMNTRGWNFETEYLNVRALSTSFRTIRMFLFRAPILSQLSPKGND